MKSKSPPPNGDEFKVLSGVPMPKAQTAHSLIAKTMKRLELHQCFDLPVDQAKRGSLYTYARYHGVRIAVRQIEENGTKVYRIWRVA